MSITYPIRLLESVSISEKIMAFFKECERKQIPIEQIGYEFEKTKTSDKELKKKRGQYYTPQYIVDYMIDYLQLDETKTIVDPACGAGTFLIPIMKRLFKGNALDNIYGIDIDHEALEVLQGLICLHKFKIASRNLIFGNTIVKNPLIDERALNLPSITPNNGFDVVIGNPPYITLKKDIDYDSCDSDYKNMMNGPVNAATLMIMKGLSILKDGGILAFVLPKNILHVGSYNLLREYLLSETTILHIVDLRSSFVNVRGEQIILFVKKEKPAANHQIDMTVFENEQIRSSVFIEQKFFSKNKKLYIFCREEDYLFIDKLKKKGNSLITIVEGQIFRGISIPAKQTTIKEKMNTSKAYTPFISGRQIQKLHYNIESFIENDLLSVMTNKKITRLTKKKIILQNIFSSEAGLIAAWDEHGVMTNETVTNVVVPSERLGKYILAFMNTKIANYFLIYGSYNCSKLTMHTDKEYIGSLPIIIPNDEEVTKIVRLIQQLETEPGSKILKQQLDHYFYQIFCLKEQEILLVESAMDEFLSKKSSW